MTRGKPPVRSVSPHEARLFAGKAEEYLETAIEAMEAGRFSVAAGNAVHAGISGGDSILGAMTGERAAGQDHRQAMPLLEQVPGAGKEVAKALGRLLKVKTRAEYDPEPLSKTDAALAVRQAAAIVTAVRTIIADRFGVEQTQR